MAPSSNPFAVQAGEGTRLETPTGAFIQVKTGSPDTSGALSMLELHDQPGNGPARHVHTREDEVWWVLQGSYRVKVGDEMFQLSEGGMAWGPRGTPHAFQNVGAAPGRLLIITTPAGVEAFFERFAGLLPGPVDQDVLSAVGRPSGIDFVGPPLAVSDPL